MRRLAFYAATLTVLGTLTMASAVDGQPAILILERNVLGSLTAEVLGKATKLETVGEKAITGSGVEAVVKGCVELEMSSLDTNLCKEGVIVFTGVKQGKVGCRSETLAATKDSLETVLAKFDAHLDAEKSTAGVLQPLLVLKLLGTDGDETLIINCGLVKEQVKGRVGCLLVPGLTNISIFGAIEIICQIEHPGKQRTGTCEQTVFSCGELATDRLLVKFGTEFWESAALEISLRGGFNKDVFIED
jgi:hypothetical protein